MIKTRTYTQDLFEKKKKKKLKGQSKKVMSNCVISTSKEVKTHFFFFSMDVNVYALVFHLHENNVFINQIRAKNLMVDNGMQRKTEV